MYSDELLEQIVDIVLLKLEQRMKNALVIFTGASIGFKEAIPQLSALMEDGWHFNVVLSNSAEYVLTPQLVKKLLGIDNIYLERETKALAPLYKGASLVIIPTLTLNSAVKIACGIADTLPTNLIAHALMEGIPVIAARNACDLKNPVRLKLGAVKTPAAYQAKMDQHLASLTNYGIQLVAAEELYERVKEGFKKPSARFYKESCKEACHFNKKVLSRIDVINAKNEGKVLLITGGTVVTTLAADTAKELNVEITRELANPIPE
ncbi:MAG TPA: flavoprotein [Negativicutes bacterium]|nr:flavoprotein [Negativicutes bacterium]